MDDSVPTAGIIFYIILLLIDIFFYGFSTAVVSLNESEIEKRANEEKDKKSIKLLKIISDPKKYINTVQLITTLINVIIGAVHLGGLRKLIDRGLVFLTNNKMGTSVLSAQVILGIAAFLSTFLVLYITLSVGVLLPKKIAVRVPEKWAYSCVNIVSFIVGLLSPITGLVTLTVHVILRLFGWKDDGDIVDVTEEEIISMVNEGHEQGIIQASEAEMISNIFEFGDKEAQDIMTHRNNIVAFSSNMLLRDAIDFMLEGKNSRYPVYEENVDHIIGILYFKDAMRLRVSPDKLELPLSEIEDLMREPVFVPQIKNIDELFREMQAEKLQLVVVVDEYGQTDGLVTMEDILEEIVGNILDEYDDESEHIEDKGNDEYVMEGKTLLEELEDLFGITFEDEEFETLNGFMISRLDKIPEPNEEFDVDYQGYNFKILSVENKMVQRVLVTKLPEVEEVSEDNDEVI